MNVFVFDIHDPGASGVYDIDPDGFTLPFATSEFVGASICEWSRRFTEFEAVPESAWRAAYAFDSTPYKLPTFDEWWYVYSECK